MPAFYSGGLQDELYHSGTFDPQYWLQWNVE